MRFKTLKHKTLKGVFGQIDLISESLPHEKQHEILQTSIPSLYMMTATMENITEYWTKYEQEILLEQLKDYDLVTVDLKIIL